MTVTRKKNSNRKLHPKRKCLRLRNVKPFRKANLFGAWTSEISWTSHHKDVANLFNDPDLFTVPPIQTAIAITHYVNYYPISRCLTRIQCDQGESRICFNPRDPPLY